MKIPIVDKDDNIVGEEERALVHKNGLRHREIHVWLVTPNKEFIFQKRGNNTDTWPGFLDVTVGGHLDTAQEDYRECAVRELEEETGVIVPIIQIMKIYSESSDPHTNTHNHAFRATFAGIFNGPIEDLKNESGGKGEGFVKYTIEEIMNFSEEDKKQIIPKLYSDEYKPVYKKIIEVLFNETQS